MRIINIMVGGPAGEIPVDLVDQHADEPWIGVDFGALFLLRRGITPAMAVGDFDTIGPAALERVRQQVERIEVSPAVKDYTDTELAVKVAFNELNADRVRIFGATGGRLDQLLNNLFFPLLPEFADHLTQIELVDRQNWVTYYRPGEYAIEHLAGMKYLTFVTLTPVENLTLPDEKYRLDHYSSTVPISWSSNEFTAPVNHFSFESGVVAVIQSKDSAATGPRH